MAGLADDFKGVVDAAKETVATLTELRAVYDEIRVGKVVVGDIAKAFADFKKTVDDDLAEAKALKADLGNLQVGQYVQTLETLAQQILNLRTPAPAPTK